MTRYETVCQQCAKVHTENSTEISVYQHSCMCKWVCVIYNLRVNKNSTQNNCKRKVCSPIFCREHWIPGCSCCFFSRAFFREESYYSIDNNYRYICILIAVFFISQAACIGNRKKEIEKRFKYVLIYIHDFDYIY